MTPLTIIYVHKNINNGNEPQIEAAIESARLHSPKSRTVIITDTPERFVHMCETFCIEQYWDLADSYLPIYKHHSQLSPEFERMAISRWLVIQEFVRREGVDQFFSADSDVMIFTDMEKLRKVYDVYDFTLSTDGKIPGFRQAGSMFCNATTLNAFSKYLFDREGHGGNDMNLWTEFASEGQFKRGENNVIADGATGDHHVMYQSWEYEHDDIRHPTAHNCTSKKLMWKGGYPYCKHYESGQYVRFNWLHCWGVHKQLMKFHMQCSLDTLDVKDHYQYFQVPPTV